MFKIGGVLAAIALLVCTGTWNGFTLPRLTHGAADYVLMPFLGYLSIILLAQLGAWSKSLLTRT